MTLDTESRQNSPRETSSGSSNSQPQNHDPNRNNFGSGTGSNRNYQNRVSSIEGSSNSSFYSSYVGNSNYR